MIDIGEIIRSNRERLGISQEDLSYKICSVSNLSRIERGEQIPSRIKYESFMQRMGLPSEIYPSFLNSQEEECFRLRHEINRAFIADRYEEVKGLLGKLEAMPKLEPVYRQFDQFVRALLLRREGGEPAEVLAAMQQVVEASVEDFSPKNILRHVLTKDEINILFNLAISYYDAGEQDYGIEILYSLKDYIERKVADNDGITPIYTAILHALTSYIGRKGRYEEALKLCDICIQRCIEYGVNFAFAGILYHKGYTLVMLERKEEAQKYIRQAYYIHEARNELARCEIVKAFADKHGIAI